MGEEYYERGNAVREILDIEVGEVEEAIVEIAEPEEEIRTLKGRIRALKRLSDEQTELDQARNATMTKYYKPKELQDIASACLDYLKVHDSHWPRVTFSRLNFDIEADGRTYGANRQMENGKWAIFINEALHEEHQVHVIRTLVHECAHIWYAEVLKLGPRQEEAFVEAIEPILFDMWEASVF